MEAYVGRNCKISINSYWNKTVVLCGYISLEHFMEGSTVLMKSFVGPAVQEILSDLGLKCRSVNRYWPYSQYIWP